MSVNTKQLIDTESTEFTEGVEAGLNSAADTQNWKAGNELGQALKEDGETKKPVHLTPTAETLTPLFMQDSQEGAMGNAQDEKDGGEE